jgi:hypothetical protein
LNMKHGSSNYSQRGLPVTLEGSLWVNLHTQVIKVA